MIWSPKLQNKLQLVSELVDWDNTCSLNLHGHRDQELHGWSFKPFQSSPKMSLSRPSLLLSSSSPYLSPNRTTMVDSLKLIVAINDSSLLLNLINPLSLNWTTMASLLCRDDQLPPSRGGFSLLESHSLQTLNSLSDLNAKVDLDILCTW